MLCAVERRPSAVGYSPVFCVHHTKARRTVKDYGDCSTSGEAYVTDFSARVVLSCKENEHVMSHFPPAGFRNRAVIFSVPKLNVPTCNINVW